jgi:hypothetical protein
MTQFKRGESGNPAGRPKGQAPATQLRKAIADAAPDIINTLILAAKDGDLQACKVLLDKVVPALRPEALPVQIDAGASLAESGSNVINAAMSGDVPPDVGANLIAALAAQSRVIEITELAARLERIENELTKRASS